MFSKLTIALFTLTISTSALAAKPGTVTAEKKENQLVIKIDGKPFAVYQANFDGKLPKPFFFPVHGPGGAILTRPIERKGDDHPHHKGIWVAVDEVNGVRFWAEKGKIVTKKMSVSAPSKDGSLEFQVTNAWQNANGKTEVFENTKIRIYPNRLLTYDIEFSHPKHSVVFEDTKEGIFGFRMVNSMRESEGGHVVSSSGAKGTKACWGKPAKWIDYYGNVDGKTYGVAIFDHPKNLRPSRYHVRNYGLFSISPFGEKAYTRGKNPAKPVHLEPGQKLRLRYAMYIHAGDTKAAKVADVYQQYLKVSK